MTRNGCKIAKVKGCLFYIEMEYSKGYGTLGIKLKKSNVGSLGAYLLSFTISQHGSTEPSGSTAVLRLWCVC